MDPEADRAFQDLKKYMTIPLVMVAPRPLEPLVLYLAATPYSASATLVAIREEHQAKGASRRATPPAETTRDQKSTTRATAATAEEQDQQDDAPEPAKALTSDQALGAPPPQETPQLPKDASLINTPTLVEHLVYFVSTVLRDARARYPMPQKLLLALLVASHKLRHYFQGHTIKVISAYPLERVLRSPNLCWKGR